MSDIAEAAYLKAKQVEQQNSELSAHFQTESGLNLFNRDSASNIAGYYRSPSTGNDVADSSFTISHFIPIQNGHTYVFDVYYSFFGGTAAKIRLYDASFTSIATPTGTLLDDNDHARITIASADAVYVVANTKGGFQFIEASNYPTAYNAYGSKSALKADPFGNAAKSLFNPLWGKYVVFEGTSLTAGTGDSAGGGFVTRLSTRNNMAILNSAVGGGTVAYYDSEHHCICRAVATLHQGADYFIFNGGANDADYEGAGNAGELTTGYSAAFTDTIFAHAMEKTIKAAIARYPTKKIGFIISYKNGDAATQANRKAYFDVAILACKKWGIPYLNLWDDCYINQEVTPTLFYDTQHLNAAGYDTLTPIIEAWMKTL